MKIREFMVVNKENPKTKMLYQDVTEVNEVLTDDGLEAWELVRYDGATATFTKQNWKLFERVWHRIV